MVKLTKIYTKSGDSGTTGLATGDRISKGDDRVEAYGTVDEANASLGLVVVEARETGHGEVAAHLEVIQNDLFDVGADLATPVTPDEAPDQCLRVTAPQTERLEGLIDEHNADLPALTSFVLPGGTRLAAAMHVARTVIRRAERDAVRLLESDADATNPEAVRYLNRLSDLLFVLARHVNDRGTRDVLWVPGKNR